jgi:hypothetical protein
VKRRSRACKRRATTSSVIEQQRQCPNKWEVLAGNKVMWVQLRQQLQRGNGC